MFVEPARVALSFDVKDPSGKVVNWAVEMNSPGVLRRAGWTKNTFKAGDQITITVRPARAGTPVGSDQSCAAGHRQRQTGAVRRPDRKRHRLIRPNRGAQPQLASRRHSHARSSAHADAVARSRPRLHSRSGDNVAPGPRPRLRPRRRCRTIRSDLSGVWTRQSRVLTMSNEAPPMTAWGKAKFDAAKPVYGPRAVPAVSATIR